VALRDPGEQAFRFDAPWRTKNTTAVLKPRTAVRAEAAADAAIRWTARRSWCVSTFGSPFDRR
jgi:hypothetical protein